MVKLRPFELERFFAKHEFSARHLLGSSDPESMSLEELLAMEPGAERRLLQLRLGYTESLGDPALREAIAAQHEGLRAEDILVFTGAEEPIFAFMNVALEPGDHLVVHVPAYQSHHAIAASRGVEISPWMGDPERGWALDPEELRRLIRPNTKAILVSVPHNPTGFIFEAKDWERVIAIARERGIWLFSDEVYRGTEHDPAYRLPSACDRYDRAITLNCLSKSYGLAGLRLGWIATRDQDLLQRLAAFKDYLTICNSAPSELLGTIAMRHSERLFERTRQRLIANLDLLEAFFQRQQRHFQWQRPRAGTTTFHRFLGGSALAFCERLVEGHGIMLVPSPFFDLGDEHLRFGYGRADLPEVLPLLEAALKEAFPS